MKRKKFLLRTTPIRSSWRVSIVFILAIFGIILITLYFHREKQKRDEFQKLSRVVNTLERLLPPPNTSSPEQLMQLMPTEISRTFFDTYALPVGASNREGKYLEWQEASIHYLRSGFRYYPERQAFKYTFNDGCERGGDGKCHGRFYIPYSLERRSIWFKVQNGKWTCYAGINPEVRQNLCTDSSIVQGLSQKEHETAIIRNDCSGLDDWLSALHLPRDIRLYYLHSHYEKELYIGFNQHNPSILIIDVRKGSTDEENVYLFHSQVSDIRAIILNGDIDNHIKLYGLPKNIPIFNRTQTMENCQQIAGHGEIELSRNFNFKPYSNYPLERSKSFSDSDISYQVWNLDILPRFKERRETNHSDTWEIYPTIAFAPAFTPEDTQMDEKVLTTWHKIINQQ